MSTRDELVNLINEKLQDAGKSKKGFVVKSSGLQPKQPQNDVKETVEEPVLDKPDTMMAARYDRSIPLKERMEKYMQYYFSGDMKWLNEETTIYHVYIQSKFSYIYGEDLIKITEKIINLGYTIDEILNGVHDEEIKTICTLHFNELAKKAGYQNAEEYINFRVVPEEYNKAIPLKNRAQKYNFKCNDTSWFDIEKMEYILFIKSKHPSLDDKLVNEIVDAIIYLGASFYDIKAGRYDTEIEQIVEYKKSGQKGLYEDCVTVFPKSIISEVKEQESPRELNQEEREALSFYESSVKKPNEAESSVPFKPSKVKVTEQWIERNTKKFFAVGLAALIMLSAGLVKIDNNMRREALVNDYINTAADGFFFEELPVISLEKIASNDPSMLPMAMMRIYIDTEPEYRDKLYREIYESFELHNFEVFLLNSKTYEEYFRNVGVMRDSAKEFGTKEEYVKEIEEAYKLYSEALYNGAGITDEHELEVKRR